ncbi:MAG: pentapeptide repeat-containing protein [Prochloraceae cyanobacterium]|nr:pentapeptide repeat-containing protein [Prochloraceae cyanobacterium]
MANRWHLNILEQGVETWNRWREENSDIEPDLRGANLKGRELVGADFSNADIRSTNFTGANLREAKFCRAKAGLQRRWATLLVIISRLLLLISGSLVVFTGSCVVPAREALSIENLLVVGISLIILFWLTLNRGLVTSLGVFAVPLAGVFAAGVSVAGSGAVAVVAPFTLALTLAFAGTLNLPFAETLALALAGAVFFVENLALALALAFIMTLLCGYVAWEALKGNEKYALIRNIAIAFAAIGGTSFRGADLTDADFTKATLKSTDLRKAILTRTCWRDTEKLDRVRLGESYLKDAKLRKLLITGEARKKIFDRLDLRVFNLSGANLANASFIDADLYEANLTNANLSGAILVGTKLEQAILKGAELTGGCIEDWKVSKDTVIDDIKCEYIYQTYSNGNKIDPKKFKENEFFLFLKSKVGDLNNLDLSNKNLSGIDLNEARLYEADLTNTNLSKTNLTRADLRLAKLNGANLNKAKLNDANLSGADLSGADLSEAELVETNLNEANLAGAKLNDANLSGAFLKNVDLTGANLTGALLNEATISNANLTEANLTETLLFRTQAQRADLTRVTLTGACIEDWNINSETILKDVICDYVYLKCVFQNYLTTKGRLKTVYEERRPADRESKFKPREFADLFGVISNTVDLVFENGIDWTAFFSTFKELQEKYQDDNLSIAAIEKKASGAFVIKLKISEEANKALVERQAKQLYEENRKELETYYNQQLQIKETKIRDYERENTNLWELAKLAASRDIGDKIYIHGPSGVGVNIGTITAETLAGIIKQLPSSSNPENPGIKELLEQLKNTIATSEELGDKEKS